MNPAPPTIVQQAGDEFLIATTPSGHAIAIDVKGGRKSAPGPLELFVVGLGSCTASDVIAILRKKREQVTAYHVEIRTERREEHPRSFRRIELKHVIRGHNISTNSVERAIELSTEKYCGAIATVRATAEVVTTYQVLPEESTGTLTDR
jgi:putative redox protein